MSTLTSLSGHVHALVLAAGRSTRMGGATPKQLLPWGPHTVIEQVVATLLQAGFAADEITVVTGHRREEVEGAVAHLGVRCVHNPAYAEADMLASIQAGLRSLPDGCGGALLALADQPQMQVQTVRQVVEAFQAGGGWALVIPSYQMRRGHPILLPARLWPEVLALPADASLRAVVQRHAHEIHYVVVDTPTVLADLDTPEDYRAAAPASSLEPNPQP
ncbi:MAG: nucleotidyltransferase family protein [Caldilineales bacterium]|nr:nucleotidyltransferase family protein [Caldilineales bacterium]MDW8316580.1 nucleotidyltransferase family protein [Anaerolineae bacterium]